VIALALRIARWTVGAAGRVGRVQSTQRASTSLHP
jgi:hypothetical protein